MNWMNIQIDQVKPISSIDVPNDELLEERSIEKTLSHY